jgi:hypothetical protein
MNFIIDPLDLITIQAIEKNTLGELNRVLATQNILSLCKYLTSNWY